MYFSKDQYDDFSERVEQLIGPAAVSKGYIELDQLKERLGIVEGHAVGEIIYKVARFWRQKDPSDVEKIAAWAFLLWVTTQGKDTK